jgi:phosphoglycolate phosphatase
MHRAVFFDVDGVLLDSLPQHLAICADKAREFGLDLAIPDVPAFRRMIASGVSVSPMLNFFRAVGFPQAPAERATADYEREFMQCYRPQAFEGIDTMLQRLRAAGFSLGLVTANTAANVEPALGDSMRHFDPRCRFYVDSFEPPRGKAACLAEAARRLDLAPEAIVFVGDQPADARAARDAACVFLAVTYGWGFSRGDTAGSVDSVDAITKALLAR